ncbi:hypothetical protein [Sphingomonas sp.]
MQRKRVAPAPHGHPFRRSLGAKPPRARPARSEDDNDIKLFVLSFTAFFICFYTFIA